jgi:hypothetical protein
VISAGKFSVGSRWLSNFKHLEDKWICFAGSKYCCAEQATSNERPGIGRKEGRNIF